MKVTIFFAILFCIGSSSYGQDIPPGVRYKKAPDEVNDRARERTQAALSNKTDSPDDFFGDVFVVGPTLWKELRSQSVRVLTEAKSVALIVPGKSPITAEGKAIRTTDEKKEFWKQFTKRFQDLSRADIRKARSEEISYFWATIPFDIEEPFYVIEAGSNRFITNFQSKDGNPLLFWIDLVGDLEKLRPEK